MAKVYRSRRGVSACWSMRGLCRRGEVPGRWRPVPAGAGASREGSAAGRADVRAGCRATRIARELQVTTKSVYQWRRAWAVGGPAALASRGPGGSTCRLSPVQLDTLRAALDAGPAVYGVGRGSAVDPGTGDHADRLAVPRSVHPAGHLVSVTASGSARRCRRIGRSNATRPRSPCGAPRRGMRFQASGGDRRLDPLRGRGRAEPAPAQGPHLGPPGTDPGVPRVR